MGQGIDSAKAAAQRVRDGAAQASDSLVTYTKENPVKAILIAAASGAASTYAFQGAFAVKGLADALERLNRRRKNSRCAEKSLARKSARR